METVYFLCGNFNGENFIYAIKSRLSDWYYFDEQDSLFDVHVSLPQTLSDEISRLNKLKEIAWSLNGDQIATYVKDGKFVFKGKELKTCKKFCSQIANFRFIFQFFTFSYRTIRHISESNRSSRPIESKKERKIRRDTQFGI